MSLGEGFGLRGSRWGGFPVEKREKGVGRVGGRNRHANAQALSKLPFSKLPFSFSPKTARERRKVNGGH